MCRAEICIHSFDGKPFIPFKANLNDMTVKQLRNQFFPSSGDLRLIHDGRPLDDDSAPLSMYSTKPRFEIQVVKKVHGG